MEIIYIFYINFSFHTEMKSPGWKMNYAQSEKFKYTQGGMIQKVMFFKDINKSRAIQRIQGIQGPLATL